MTNLERLRRALELAAVQTESWPVGQLGWGRTIDGQAATRPEDVVDGGCPAMVLSREMRVTPQCARAWLIYRWWERDWGPIRYVFSFIKELENDPFSVARHLRELAADEAELESKLDRLLDCGRPSPPLAMASLFTGNPGLF